MPLGLYISVPFCRTKCTYCNFASDVFSRAVFQRYVDRVCADIEKSRSQAGQWGATVEAAIDSLYLGGGTPTLLETPQLERIFAAIRQNFDLRPDGEITVECAPGTLTPGVIEALQRCGVNRVSLGVQSFVDKEAAAVGRLHNRATVLDDIARLRDAGISNLNLDLIAGLPHQTAHSWKFSLDEVIATAVPHVSVYMLEVDDDSRLGRELMAGGTKYHAHTVPDEDLVADLYETACQQLQAAGIAQYEISNFARPGYESMHNLKYWTRQPYLGFGVDAHSMLRFSPRSSLRSADDGMDAIRLATPDSLEQYVAGAPLKPMPIDRPAALEETFFLGLRLNRGVDLRTVAAEFGEPATVELDATIAQLRADGLVELRGDVLRLTATGRLLSNEVFEQFISSKDVEKQMFVGGS